MKDEKLSKRVIERIIEFSKHCRTCKHMRLSHSESNHCISAKGGPEQFGLCECKEWVPEDNLDYVEWLARKRGLIK